MIEVRNVTKKFMGVFSLDGVTIDFNSGDRVAIMGPNGAGKTTLVRTVLGYYHPDSGEVKVAGFNPVKSRTDVLSHISFIPQLPPPIKLTVGELLDYVAKSSGVNEEVVAENSSKMGFDIKANLQKSFFKLSGGMKQKFLISIALAKKSDILIFDEPTANLDPAGRESFYRLLEGIEEEKLVLFISHRLDEIEHLVNRVVYMDLGKVVSDEKI